MTKVGDLNQQLQMVGDFLDLPKDMVRDIGKNEVWNYIQRRMLHGERTEMIDGDFRATVKAMRQAQQSVIDCKDGSKSTKVERCREIEKRVDEILLGNDTRERG